MPVIFSEAQTRIWGAVEALLSGVYGAPSEVERCEPYVRLTWERGRSAYLEPATPDALCVVVHGLDPQAIKPLAGGQWNPRGPDARTRVAIDVPLAKLHEVARLGPIYKQWWRRPTAHAE